MISQWCDSCGRFIFYKLTLHRFVRMVTGPLVWTQWEKAGQEEPHWNKRQTTRVIYSAPTNTNSFSKVRGLTQEVLGLFPRDTIRIAQCMHGLWTVEFSNGRLGASHYCSKRVVFGYSLPPQSTADLVTHKFLANEHPLPAIFTYPVDPFASSLNSSTAQKPQTAQY